MATLDNVTWERCRDEFNWQGGLLDIYVDPASLLDWELFIRTLPVWPYKTEYSQDLQAMPIPTDVSDIFFIAREEASTLLKIFAGAIQVNCHFFSEDELEFDIDPRDVDSAADFDSLLGFMRRLGLLLKQPVKLTPENLPDSLIIVFFVGDNIFRYFEP